MSRSLLRYLLAGGIAYFVDVSVFGGLRFIPEIPIAYANVLARSIGAITAYGLNHLWTFRQSLTRVNYSALRYLGLWLINTLLSTTLLQGLSGLALTLYHSIALKAMIEGVLVLSNFIVCKFWVFKNP